MVSTESECAEVDEPKIEQVDGRKNEETTWSVTNCRIVIDFYKDNAVLYDKSHKDYGNKVVTKKVFAALLAKMPDKTITDIKKGGTHFEAHCIATWRSQRKKWNGCTGKIWPF